MRCLRGHADDVRAHHHLQRTAIGWRHAAARGLAPTRPLWHTDPVAVFTSCLASVRLQVRRGHARRRICGCHSVRARSGSRWESFTEVRVRYPLAGHDFQRAVRPVVTALQHGYRHRGVGSTGRKTGSGVAMTGSCIYAPLNAVRTNVDARTPWSRAVKVG
jgi:hypothetical protein